MNANTLPATIADYLNQLRTLLADADPSMVLDALYDAEDYLRCEQQVHPELSEEDVVGLVAQQFGTPAEVANTYRETESTVQRALHGAPNFPREWNREGGRWLGVFTDARTYGAVFYMLLSLATGLFYFSWVAVGLFTSIGLTPLLVGLPLLVAYVGSIRILSLVEGRVVESMLGQRMPRRPQYEGRHRSIVAHIGALFRDPRIWGTQLYFLLMLPLGCLYSSLVAGLLTISIVLIVWPLLTAVGVASGNATADAWHLLDTRLIGFHWVLTPAYAMVSLIVGIALLMAILYLARSLGQFHGALAKRLLVKSSAWRGWRGQASVDALAAQ